MPEVAWAHRLKQLDQLDSLIADFALNGLSAAPEVAKTLKLEVKNKPKNKILT